MGVPAVDTKGQVFMRMMLAVLLMLRAIALCDAQMNLSDSEYFLASSNVQAVAKRMGYWDESMVPLPPLPFFSRVSLNGAGQTDH